MNCLFLHLFVAKDGYHQSAIAELLRTSFISLPLLHYIFLSSSPDAQLGPVLSAHFSPVTSLLSGVEETRLWATQRHQHFPVVHIRSAVVEDADDLMPIFQHCSATDVHQQYGRCLLLSFPQYHDILYSVGEYFLAEMIESQDEHHQTLVAEVSGRAVGFMSVSSEVDIDYLNECYQLESFHGLKHPEDSDEVQTISTDG